jgi:hypothetical protein
MNEVIKNVIFIGYSIKISREVNQCLIQITDDKGNAMSQMLPMDSHLDYAFEKCVRFMVDKLFHKEAQ